MPVTAPIFTELHIAHWYHVKMFDTTFHPKRSTNLQIKCADFHKAHLAQRLFVKNFYSKFHENLPYCLVFDTISQTDWPETKQLNDKDTHEHGMVSKSEMKSNLTICKKSVTVSLRTVCK